MSPILSIVCPCYNEELVITESVERLVAFLDECFNEDLISKESFVLLVDDGSLDQTWQMICEAVKNYEGRIEGVRLSRNVGHQNALMAGLTEVTSRCDAAITIDVDLQDDLNAVKGMIKKYLGGAEIVLGVKRSRDADPAFKRATARMYYWLMAFMGVNLVPNHADCRLLSTKALANLNRYPERALFLRGLQTLLHGNVETILYDIQERRAGASKYNLRKMLKLAIDGITSFSVVPLRLISAMGALVFFASLTMALYTLFASLLGFAIPGWASIVIPIYIIGGLLMLSLGVVGEYVGKIFIEVKQRPRFIVDERQVNRPSGTQKMVDGPLDDGLS
jgi:glycosyltransferase involved in cell wall biosynthesis